MGLKVDKNTNHLDAVRSLAYTFPSVESFMHFKETDRDVSDRSIPEFLKYAHEHSLIKEESEAAFLDLIEKNGRDNHKNELSNNLSFGDVIEELSGRRSVNSLIQQLEIISKNFALPKIQAPMITRLKNDFLPNTAKKRALLRVLAFKLGERRPELGLNYEHLLALPRGPVERVAPNEKEGVILAIHINGRGDIIEPAAVKWLQDELRQCIDDLRFTDHIQKKMVETSGVTSVALKLPKKAGPSEELRIYNQVIRDSLALAHQISVRWLLSRFHRPYKSLIVAIQAGDFSENSLFFGPILQLQSPENSGIYLTERALLCSRMAGVKAAFEPSGTGVWKVIRFFTHSYYDFIPSLLKPDALPVSIEAQGYNDFRQALFSPKPMDNRFKALSAMHQNLSNDLLLIEIAKVLTARCMYYEADAVIAYLLMSHPRHITARLLRMVLYFKIGLNQGDPLTTRHLFDRATWEGRYLSGFCEDDSEVHCQIGIVQYGIAVNYLKQLLAANDINNRQKLFPDVTSYLAKAKESFKKGITVSSDGKDNRSTFWLAKTSGLLESILEQKDLIVAERRFDASRTKEIFSRIGLQTFTTLGWIRNFDLKDNADPLSEEDVRNLIDSLMLRISSYSLTAMSRSFRPFTTAGFCSFFWDLMPVLTFGVCRYILTWLNEACLEAEKLTIDNIAVDLIYSKSMHPEDFIREIKAIIDMFMAILSEDDLDKGIYERIDKSKSEELIKINLTLLFALNRQTI